jgi:hypothetical protein
LDGQGVDYRLGVRKVLLGCGGVLAHEDEGEKPELPAQEDAFEDGAIPGIVSGLAEPLVSMLSLFAG